MRAIFWKTTRELLKWAVVGMTANIAAMTVAMWEWLHPESVPPQRVAKLLVPPLMSDAVIP
ncbi:MAG: hypothetical protein IT442_10550, partial [Phycisphaeraceae bacterium]|nr:hypothetical protein [Phycisphaeraceae bacterium]